MTQTALNVVMIAGDAPPLVSGVGDYTTHLTRALARQGAQVTLATTRAPGLPERERAGRVEVRRIMGRWDFSDLKAVLGLLREQGPATLVHIQYPCTSYGRQPMVNFLPALIRLKKPGIPTVVTTHGFQEHRFIWRARVAPMLLAANGLIFVTSRDRDLVESWLRVKKPHSQVIPIAGNIPVATGNGASREAVRNELGFAPEHTVIAFFGGMRPDKGFLDLLMAGQALRPECGGLRLLVIGGFANPYEASLPYAQKVRRLLEETEQESWVAAMPAPEAERVSQLFRAADLAVFPFTLGASENRGSMLAAMAHELPVVTTRGPATPPGFAADYGVETVPVGDQRSLIASIGRLVRSPEAREELSRRAARAGKNYSWDDIALKTLSFYQTILNGTTK